MASSSKDEVDLDLKPIPIPHIPVIPVEIWGLIFCSLEKSDLLNCRAVCHSHEWDLEIRKTLRSKFSRSTLNMSNIGEFIEFASTTGTSLVQPFHLKWEILIFTEESGSQQFAELNNYWEQLNTLFGLECVEELSISVEPTAKGQAVRLLADFLSKHSLGLKSLNLTFQIQNNLRSFAATDLLDFLNEEYANVTFPNLTELKFCFMAKDFFRQVEHEITGAQEFVRFFIIRKAEKLRVDFGLHASRYIPPDLLPNFSLPIHILSKLKLTGLNRNEAKAFAHAFSIASEDNWRILGRRPTVRMLKIDNPKGNDNMKLHLHPIRQIIESLGNSLTKLVILVDANVSTRNLNLPHLPELPHLKSLKIRVKNVDLFKSPHLIHKQFYLNFKPSALPALESVDLPLGSIFLPSDNLDPFPSVRSLTLRSMGAELENEDLTLPYVPLANPSVIQTHVLNLQLAFPNVTKLVAVAEGKWYTRFFMIRLLIEFLVSGRAGLIQELGLYSNTGNELLEAFTQLNRFKPRIVIKNFSINPELVESIMEAVEQDSSLVRVTTEAPDLDELGNPNCVLGFDEIQLNPKHKMTNVRSLLLGLTKSKYRKEQEGLFGGGGPLFRVNEANLRVLRRNFPSLTGVRISPELLATEEDIRNEEIQQLLSVFPDSIVQ